MTREKRDYTVFIVSIVASLFLGGLRLSFIQKWSEKKALQVSVERNVFWDFCVFVVEIPWNTPSACDKYSDTTREKALVFQKLQSDCRGCSVSSIELRWEFYFRRIVRSNGTVLNRLPVCFSSDASHKEFLHRGSLPIHAESPGEDQN